MYQPVIMFDDFFRISKFSKRIQVETKILSQTTGSGSDLHPKIKKLFRQSQSVKTTHRKALIIPLMA